MMRFASLGSGSRGNALLIEAGRTRVLLDCGFALSELELRLARFDLVPNDLRAIVVTHEHEDHVGGVARLARKYAVPLYLTYGTLMAIDGELAADAVTVVIDAHASFAIDDLEVHPYPVPHDAREPAQFVFGDGAARLGVLTDAGSITPHIVFMLSGLDALMLECNHDAGMLAQGDYPASLKRRIASRIGHLDNGTAAELVAKIDRSRLKHVIAAHLSQQNNTPQLAQAALATGLGTTPDWIGVASQEEGFGWRQIA